jgi:7-carboxy-7-deazaguanine synthase
MAYSVKEIFYTLQGEGAQAGRPSVFCRFSGCNLWSGREEDRATADCRFCDTDFVGTDGMNGGKFATPQGLADAIAGLWPARQSQAKPYVVFTGGEPCLQLDAPLLDAMHERGFETAIETNGTLPVPKGVDWVCVSPKPGPPMQQQIGDELKLVFPQSELSPNDFKNMNFNNFFLQPKDEGNEGSNLKNRQACIAYCLENPQWRLSLQTHKLTGLP